MTRIKICGVTTAAQAAAVAKLGVGFIGVNGWPGSPRFVAAPHMMGLAEAARHAHPLDTPRVVGVFVDQARDDMLALHRQGAIEVIQLHGDEPPRLAEQLADRGAAVWKATTLAALTACPAAHWQQAGVQALVLDAAAVAGGMPGGTGRIVDWRRAADVVAASPLPVILAGGLSPANVANAVRQVAPWAVDVASGVEAAPGIKDLEKVAAFVKGVASVGLVDVS